ncbi:von Willebrand factor A domain-containing protein DDB_G0286969 isoform X1 [Amyelois transitella]|uniref:von Willebrand factor A domain-containing protein DDB_G0286969 isoform X1 n=1 Tax=Amyelois transitella TaxID=680683 RepID=UPI00298F72A3|nr:von Willebrand factor A domain-containing protein DDB_G0286969 isoform X1 [Amyelois transitella]
MLMVQTNAQPMKTNKVKGPPPVPPRPNQSVVAEALAKTRKAVADSKANLSKSRTLPKQEQQSTIKAKTLDRASKPAVSPKQNGLARVKSFIKDVISDRSSSSDEKRSSGQNSRRSSSDSSSIHTPSSTKRSNESLNSKAVKTCKQILVRSLSTSNKLDQDAKCKVTKSSSFAEKTLPLRKAPPPPLSPKPKLKPMKPLPVYTNCTENNSPKQTPTPELSPYSSPLDAKPPQSPGPEAPYATVEEMQDFDNRLRNSPAKQVNNVPDTQLVDNTSIQNGNNNSLERKTSRVTEMLISEIIASRNNNKDEANAVIDKGKDPNLTNGNDSPEVELRRDMNNHEMLIYELQTMRSQSNVPENLDPKEFVDRNGHCDSEDSEQNYAMSSVTSGNTDDVYDQAYAYILDDDLKSRLRKQYRAISTMSLHGLPPLPKSLSGFAEVEPDLQETPHSGAGDKPPTDLDSQLTYLKKEMASLRQLDLSLLSELWTLSEAMASWRRQLERGPRLRPAPPPPPPPHYLRT